ncbi:hypothetical protein LNP25_00870 [Klebsiella variicola subsp. variicola]|nr:hypothetical protein [Klebsiella variicola subsp. variicola]
MKKPKPCWKQQEQQSDRYNGRETIRRYLASYVSPAIVARYRHTFPQRYIGWILRKPAVRNAAAVWRTSAKSAWSSWNWSPAP